MTEAAPSLRHRIASHLLTIGAVSLSPEAPFTWASGMRSPIYCDNRLTMAYPEVRRDLAQGFANLVQTLGLQPEAVVGIATAGIPHAAWLADRLGIPMAYVRAQPKEHGRGNQIEGLLTPGQRVVVIEDLISTGGSSLGAIQAVRAAGVEVEALLAIFSYGLPLAAQRFAEADLRYATLTDLETLLAVAVEKEMLPAASVDMLRDWQKDPSAWSLAHQEG